MFTRDKGKAFPRYSSHEVASCFNCGSDLDGYWAKSGYADGRGAFLQCCSKCQMNSWYDLEESKK